MVIERIHRCNHGNIDLVYQEDSKAHWQIDY